MPVQVTRKKKIRLSSVLSVGRLRTDLWSRLASTADELDLAARSGRDTSELETEASDILVELGPYERYWIYPGAARLEGVRELLERSEFDVFAEEAGRIAQLIGEYGDGAVLVDRVSGPVNPAHYFTVLLVDDVAREVIDSVVAAVEHAGVTSDEFAYEILHVDNVVDGLAAALLNSDVQACVVRADARPRSDAPGPLDEYLEEEFVNELNASDRRGAIFGELMRELRPELDLYLIAGESVMAENLEEHAAFDRAFYRLDDPIELHLTVLEGIRQRYETPFFDALVRYAQEPVGNFHALPIARGHSIFNSKWIRDMGEFYGRKIFLAETSSTSGGLDSLLAPKGTIADAQAKAAKAFGSRRTFFSTNGTSTSNKIVVQALTGPGDIVLIDRNCHISHHYGLVLGGAYPLYLEAYALEEFAMFGAVPLRVIKARLLELRRAGRLDQVKMLLLTNCTFDGIVYDPMRLMAEVLAIKPDIIFLWDEAWFAYANSSPIARSRTAMYGARHLEARLASDEYQEHYADWKRDTADLDWEDEATWLETSLLPDPDRARVRVYATHSTHKSLSALRQGSMMHVFDQDFDRLVADDFTEALQTHTSTSPNYQIIASLDLARRQVQLEGYGMVDEAYQMALTLRDQIATDALLSRYFRVLGPRDLIPAEFRGSGIEEYVLDDDGEGDEAFVTAIDRDEFMLDPTRNTLYIAATGFNGNEFKVDVLMDRFGIQVNKTSINSVLMIMSIGVTWSGMAYVLDALRKVAREIDTRKSEESEIDAAAREARIRRLTDELPPLPGFSGFHPAFRPNPATSEGDVRSAFFLSREPGARHYVPLADAIERSAAGEELVSTTMVVPYPPGFPVLVPGQVVSSEILDFMDKLDVKEIHGYRADAGLSVFTDDALAEISPPAKRRRDASAGNG